jgi:hypothetical protein
VNITSPEILFLKSRGEREIPITTKVPGNADPTLLCDPDGFFA